MSIFDTLLLGHLMGDFLFQNAWMADEKKRRILPLLVHATVYTLCILVFSFNTDFLGWKDYFIIWGTHVIIDSRKLTSWWARTVMGITSAMGRRTWLSIVVDQVFHLLVFYILILLKA
jgi:hypothetical protein